MKVLKLVIKNAMRHKLRSFLTAAGIGIAILAFSLLRTVIDAYFIGVEASSQTRLITRHRVSLNFFLPLAYKEKIAAIPGVTEVSYGCWFGGTYVDPKNFFGRIAVEPETFMTLYPEFMLTPAEKESFLKERNSCIVGRKLAAKYGWEIGDTFRLIGDIFPGEWDFVIRGIYRGRDRATDETTMYFHWKYIDERLSQGGSGSFSQVGWYYVGVENADDVVRICKAVDEKFTNSLAESKTETEKEFNLSFISMVGTIITAVRVISIVVIAIILLVLANTMAMTARERISEFAVLKTLGFRPQHIVGLIFGESAFITFAGWIFGMMITLPTIAAFGAFLEENVGSFFPVFEISVSTLILSVIAALSVGVLSGLFPTLYTVNMKISDGLRQVG
jgi:putative ABC transport system permease protein